MKEHPIRFTGPKYAALPGKPSPFARYGHVKHIKVYRTDQHIADSEGGDGGGGGDTYEPVQLDTAEPEKESEGKGRNWGGAAKALGSSLQQAGANQQALQDKLDAISKGQRDTVKENITRAMKNLQ